MFGWSVCEKGNGGRAGLGAVCGCVGGSPGGTDGSAEPGVHLRRVGHLGAPLQHCL